MILKILSRSIYIGLLLILIPDPAVSSPGRLSSGARTKSRVTEATVVPPACMPHTDDYGIVWWAGGYPVSPASPRIECIRTGSYGLALDVDKMQIVHLGPLSHADAYQDAVQQSHTALDTLPAADLKLKLTVEGKEYVCTQGAIRAVGGGPRLIDSGRFVQRTDVTGLTFTSREGEPLPVDARLETLAWPDRLTLKLFAAPALREPKGGPSFGRVGGGYYFDGHNHVEAPNSGALEPPTLTAECWVYLPDIPQTVAETGWIFCKNSNEWAEGNYGIMMAGRPVATMNIGGGQANQVTVPALTPLTTARWNHLAMTYDGQTLRFYVNGTEQGSKHIGKARVPGTGDLAIGRRQDVASDGYYNFRGGLDEMRITGRALSPEEIAAHVAHPEAVRADPAEGGAWLFDPKGPALLTQASPHWTQAEMSIALKSAGHTFTDRLALQPQEDWTSAQTKSVSVSVLPAAAGGIATAPSESVTAIATSVVGNKPLPASYDPIDGCIRIDYTTAPAIGQGNFAQYRANIVLTNPAAVPQVARLVFHRDDCTPGMMPMLLEPDGTPTGLTVQISKDWHRYDRTVPYNGPWFHGYSILRLPAHSQVRLQFAQTKALWGTAPSAAHAQLSLIGYGGEQLWHEASLGDWGESICFQTDQALSPSSICDVRPLMVHASNNETPTRWTWTNNVGGGDWFRCFDSHGRRLFPTDVKAGYHRYGPNLTDVSYTGEGGEGAYHQQVSVSLYRTDDMTRGIYHLRMKVTQALDFSRFVLFQVGADTYNSDQHKIALGNETGLIREWDTRSGGNSDHGPPLECTGSVPWISLHAAVSQDKSSAGAWANRGIVIRSWSARLGGKPARPYMAEFDPGSPGSGSSLADLVPPPGVTRLLPGDFVDAVVEHVIVPQYAKDYYGPNVALKAALLKQENTWQMVAREAAGNDPAVKVSRGTLQNVWPVRIAVTQGHEAQFTVTGGVGYLPITLTGLTSPRSPILLVRSAGSGWQRIDQAVYGNDFWQTDYDPIHKTYDITYTVPVDTPGDKRSTREFKFLLDTNGAATKIPPAPDTDRHQYDGKTAY